MSEARPFIEVLWFQSNILCDVIFDSEFVTVDTSVQSWEKRILVGHKNVIPRASVMIIKEHPCTLFEILCSRFWYFFDSCRVNTWLEQVVSQGSKSNKESEHIQTLSAEKIWPRCDYLPLQAEKNKQYLRLNKNVFRINSLFLLHWKHKKKRKRRYCCSNSLNSHDLLFPVDTLVYQMCTNFYYSTYESESNIPHSSCHRWHQTEKEICYAVFECMQSLLKAENHFAFNNKPEDQSAVRHLNWNEIQKRQEIQQKLRPWMQKRP